jgi:hypothetical protein
MRDRLTLVQTVGRTRPVFHGYEYILRVSFRILYRLICGLTGREVTRLAVLEYDSHCMKASQSVGLTPWSNEWVHAAVAVPLSFGRSAVRISAGFVEANGRIKP